MFGKFLSIFCQIFYFMKYSSDEIKTIVDNCQNFDEIAGVCAAIVELYPIHGENITFNDVIENNIIQQNTRIYSLTKIKQLRNE